MTTYGIKALRQIQMSRESAIGTSTTDYKVWRGTGMLADMRVVEFPQEDIGILGGADRTYIPKKSGELNMEAVPATFEQLGYIFDAGFYEATPTTDGSGYVRTWTLPIASTSTKSSSDLQTYAFKGGDNADVEYMKGAFVKSLTLSGAAGEAFNITATWEGKEVASDSDGFETATTPTVEEILFGKAKLYIDESTGTFGATQVSNVFLSMDLPITTGWMSLFTGDGSVEFTDLKQTQPEITLNVTFEHSTSAIAEKAAFRAQTPRLVRIIAEGSALSVAGSTYTYKTLILDLAGKWESFEAIGEQDGDDIVVGTLRCRYNATAAKYFEAKLVNEVAAL